ncbi:MAG: 16S rRNA (guanine(966)-N(2))-methyltransferase RsmD [Ruminococcaceae bacterium]|nr:16S rRNA (guanine(966)-N(2))-methyltransferase RsmD [Oscillospiraceae bacterium]
MMRIITGSARGTHLYTLPGDATRPTSERAKEAVFSILQQKPVGARVLDLFAGSGQLGLEALSRGAERAVFVDGAREAVEILRRNAEKTRLSDRAEIRQSDAIAFLKSYSGAPFDLVFLDPPYAAGLLPQCLTLLRDRRLLSKQGIVVTESGAPEAVFGGDAVLSSFFELCKQNRYGVAHITVLTLKEELL